MIYPVILCGGSGTRLWPLSRKSYPKQFARLTGKQSLFQASAKRLSGEGIGPPVILTNADFRFIVVEQLAEIGIDPAAIIIEPEMRNTGPAVLAAALWLQEQNPAGLMLVAPSDHVIRDARAFRAAVKAGKSACDKGDLVTFGIRPDRPETGYGYLELAEKTSDTSPVPRKLKRFVEKPDAAKAEKFLAAGNFLWNAGIFLFPVKAIVEEFEKNCSQLIDLCERSVKEAQTDLDFLRLAPEPWGELESISIDYAVMEKAANLSVVPFGDGWSDLGGWDAVWRESDGDKNGVVTQGQATALSCSNTLLRSESPNLEVIGIGLENIAVVAMPDAVLVADMSDAQQVKKAVDTLKTKGVSQAEHHPRDHRPWGWFERISLGNRFQVKRIMVHPGASLSLQSHMHRSEHWVVVEGTARVTIGKEVSLLSENQSVYITVGERHRLENPGKVDLHLIEVQTGSYLGEDDIVRYEDVYKRD